MGNWGFTQGIEVGKKRHGNIVEMFNISIIGIPEAKKE